MEHGSQLLMKFHRWGRHISKQWNLELRFPQIGRRDPLFLRQPNQKTAISFLNLDINPDITFSSSSNHQLQHFLRRLSFADHSSLDGDHLLTTSKLPP
jgi:hypothetical protein